MIKEIRNFISEDECKKLITFYNWNKHKAFQYRDTFPLYTKRFKNITDRVESLCVELNSQIKLNVHHITMWPQGSYMDPHTDPSDDVFAALIYLNDDYSGGETCFEQFKITPETGKLLVFSNSEMLHWVSEVKDATRYTLSMWFIKSQ